MTGEPRFIFCATAPDLAALQRPLQQSECGGYASFEGWVRNHNEGQAVQRLDYEAFEELAVKEGERIIAEACAQFGVEHARCVHRIGSLAIGEIAVWVGVSAPHRDEAFRAAPVSHGAAARSARLTPSSRKLWLGYSLWKFCHIR